MIKKQTLSDKERRDWIRLIRTERVGPITFYQLLQRFGSAAAALDGLPDIFRKGKGKTIPSLPSASFIEDEIATFQKKGGVFLAACEHGYPDALAAIEDAPPILTVLGNVSVLNQRCVGVVGARNASLNGRKMAQRLSKELGEHGFVVASGLARGIDTAAHTASLETGTIAVLAGGADVVYPRENEGLYAQIMEKGAIVAEQPPGSEPIARLFPKRNRIVSGLSLGVLVVEAARKSGSLITARMALEQGREVFAVPGSPLDPRANGVNDLIRQGGILTERIDDILPHLHPTEFTLRETPSFFDLPPSEALSDDLIEAVTEKILENLSLSPVAVDELVRECEVSPQLVLASLLELELAGRVERQPGHKVVLLG